MKRILSFYGVILRPWLCVVVYLWASEFVAVFRTGIAPLLDRSADAAAILWTLIFWTALFCAVLSLAGRSRFKSAFVRTNELACRASCILVTGFFLKRWLDGWKDLYPAFDATRWLLFAALAMLGLVVWRRRRPAPRASSLLFPSWQDCFAFSALPLLLGSVVILGVKIAGHLITQKSALASSSRVSASGDQTTPASPNVIVIVADSMRAESMSLYGHPGKTTPFLERFGATSSVYLDQHTNATTTAPSITTLLSGKHPFSHGRLSRELLPNRDDQNVVRVLRDYGYSTAAVTSNGDSTFASLGLTADLTQPEDFAFRFLTLSWLRDLGVYPTRLGGRIYQDLCSLFPFLGVPRRTFPYGHLEDTFGRVREVVSRLRQPFFLFIHIHEPHGPHFLPANFKDIQIPVNESAAASDLTLKFYTHYSPVFQPVVDAYKKQYEASVHAVDVELEKNLLFLQSQSWFANSLFVFTGDHGESFERGYLNHGAELYENSTRVPLVIRFPGQKTGERVSGLTQSMDLAPTMLHGLKVPIPAWMEGQPLAPGTPPATLATVAINYKQPIRDLSFPLPTKLAIWRHHFKMIVSCAQGTTELYDLSTDPDERLNLANREVEVVKDLKRRLQRQMAQQSREPKLSCPFM